MVDINEDEVYLIVKKLMYEDDLETLIKLGSPASTYDFESREIAKAILREGPATYLGLARILRMVFFYRFHCWTLEDLPLLTPYLNTAFVLRQRLPSICIKRSL
jgi:hypothetical protein